MKMNLLFFLIGLWAVPLTVAHADAGSGEVATQAQLDALNAENALLTVQLKNIELKEKIRNNSQNNSALPLFPVPHGKRLSGAETLPEARVVLISGDPQHPIATILLDGAQIKVRVGQIIPGLGIVKSVSLDEVLIQTRQAVMSLPFVADPYSAPVGLGGMGDMNGSGTSHVPLPPLLESNLNGSHASSGLGAD